MKVNGSKWTINSATGVMTASERLQIEQPEVLEINTQREIPNVTLKLLCRVIQKKFTGLLILKLHRSFMFYEDCSDIIKTLAGSR